MTTPLTLTRPAKIHCLARLFGVSGCFRSNQSNRGLVLVVMNITTMTFVAPNLACGQARGGSISRSGSVTDEQRSHRPNSAQPFGRQLFFGQTSLLAPHRPLKGMLVARASSGRKIPRRERHRNYAHDH